MLQAMLKKVHARWLILMITAGWIGCGQNPTALYDTTALSAKLTLTDSIVQAGQKCSISARGAGVPIDSNWLLVWTGTYGDVVFRGQPADSLIVFDVPVLHFQRSGLIQLSLTRAGRVVDKRDLQIVPGPPVAVLESYAGNKTMVAGSRQRAMVMAIPKDTFENVAPAGSSVQFQLRYPGKEAYLEERTLEHLVSGVEIPAGERTGKIIIGVSSERARSSEEAVELTPAWPTQCSLDIDQWFPYADSRQNLVLRTGFIRDAANNLVADGTTVLFTVYEREQLVARYNSFTTGGVARVHIENPDRETDWKIQAQVEGQISSNILRLHFAPYVTELPFVYAAKERAIIAGPLSANLGQLVTDDLRVEVQLRSPHNTYSFSGLTENGFCKISLPFRLTPGVYQCQITAGGLVVNQEIKLP